MLKKRKEETEILHQNLEEARKEQFSKKSSMDDGRSNLCIILCRINDETSRYANHNGEYPTGEFIVIIKNQHTTE